ncbi:hypothetical protein FG386_001920 [Cryptosporidium ryanae]|uniref:uncharacterized protein n=1 Tax=Cryptosporidium ryanae TaxID=515981 RepID=UPI00351A9FAB|nr:hypothetical protein FG386_001920 [Cryptosporidium ryanae]
MSVFTCGVEKEECDGIGNFDPLYDDESSRTVLINEIEENKQLINRKVRVAGIVSEVDLVSEEMVLHYELKSVNVSLGYVSLISSFSLVILINTFFRKYSGSKLLVALEKGKIVEVVGKLTKKTNENEFENLKEESNYKLIINADIIRIVDNMNLYLHQLSILLRRKIINNCNFLK